MNVIVIHDEDPRHFCDLPKKRAWRRRSKKLRRGAIVQCAVCGQYWVDSPYWWGSDPGRCEWKKLCPIVDLTTGDICHDRSGQWTTKQSEGRYEIVQCDETHRALPITMADAP